MNRDQINKLNMFEAEDQVLTSYNALWSINPAIANAVGTFRGHITRINTNDALQKTSTKGTTVSKTQAQADMASKAVLVAQAGMAYATATNNAVLFDEMNHTENEIIRATDTDADDICQNIYDTLFPFVANTPDYGAAVSNFSDLQAAIDIYSGLIGKPKQVETISMNATGTIDSEVIAALALLDNLLIPVLRQYKATNAPFYNQFIAARVIEDIGYRKTTIFSGHTYHNNVALPGVLVTLMGTNHLGKTVNVHKLTDANGHYHITRQFYGDYTLAASLSGFTSSTVNLHVTEDKTVSTDFAM